jgi:hypothetical protein
MDTAQPVILTGLVIGAAILLRMNMATKHVEEVSGFAPASHPSNFAHNLDNSVDRWHFPHGLGSEN